MSGASASLPGTPHTSLAGRRATVMGLGLFGGGAGAARYLTRLGCDVTVTDVRGADELESALAELPRERLRFALGGHRAEDFEADLVVANPAVRPDNPWLARARAHGARVTTATELFLERTAARACALTGTQGKSTSTALLVGLLQGCGLPAHGGGNLGGSLLDRVEELGPRDVCVLELSSYQLEHLGPAPAVRVEAVGVTGVLADHLERHGTRDEYAEMKRRILALLDEDGTAVLPADDPVVAAWTLPRGRRVEFGTDTSELREEDGELRLGAERLGAAADLRLFGRFQRRNALLALGMAASMGCRPADLAAALPGVRGLPHRLEDLGLRGTLRVFDNGVSTTPDSTLSALEELPAGPIFLLAGGQPKEGLSLAPLARLAREREVKVYAFGAGAPLLADAFAREHVETRSCRDMAHAVALVFADEREGTVLFSPACASFDAWPNYLARARAFRALLPPEEAAP